MILYLLILTTVVFMIYETCMFFKVKKIKKNLFTQISKSDESIIGNYLCQKYIPGVFTADLHHLYEFTFQGKIYQYKYYPIVKEGVAPLIPQTLEIKKQNLKASLFKINLKDNFV